MPKEIVQILNISNVNTQGETVLNDGKLLQLITLYPFLYNPRVKAYKDPDYVRWAWKRINAAFNQSYEDDPKAAFSVDDLAKRWEGLKPLVRCLSNSFDLKTLPLPLRDSIIKITTNMELEEMRATSPVKKKNCARSYLMQQMENIVKLPLQQQLTIEQEILNLILNEELHHKGVKLQTQNMQIIAAETEEVLNDIDFQQVFSIAYKQEKKNILLNSIEPILLDDNNDNNDNNDSDNDVTGDYDINDYNNILGKNVQALIKPCRVRVKRLNLDDYVPLAKFATNGK